MPHLGVGGLVNNSCGEGVITSAIEEKIRNAFLLVIAQVDKETQKSVRHFPTMEKLVLQRS